MIPVGSGRGDECLACAASDRRTTLRQQAKYRPDFRLTQIIGEDDFADSVGRSSDLEIWAEWEVWEIFACSPVTSELDLARDAMLDMLSSLPRRKTVWRIILNQITNEPPVGGVERCTIRTEKAASSGREVLDF